MRISRRLRWRLRTPKVLLVSSSVLAALQLGTFDPFNDLGDFVELFLWWPLWGLLILVWFCWLVYHVIRFVQVRSQGQPRSDSPRWRWLWWVVTPGLFAATVWLIKVDAPFRFEFWISRPAFEQLAARATSAQGISTTGVHEVGFFKVTRINVDASFILFQLEDQHRFFSHQSNGAPVPAGEIDLGGGWSAGRTPDS